LKKKNFLILFYFENISKDNKIILGYFFLFG
jgi:hypothetical protein